MAQALTHQMVAREAAAMLLEDNTVVKNVNTDRAAEFGENVNGYKKGDTVKILVPPAPYVYDGASFAGGGAAPALNESSVNLTLDTQKHVPISFTAKEKSLDLSDFKKRFLRPSMNALGAIMNADILTRIELATPNVVGTWGTVPATRAVWRLASSALNRYLAPDDQRSVHFSEDANNSLAEVNATLFHSSKELQAEFDKNAVGMFGGFEFFTNQSLPVFTNGAGAGYLINGAGGGVGAGTGALTVDTGTGAVPKGAIITIAGVNAAHPLTGADVGVLRQFVVTTAYAGGAGALNVYPAIIASAAGVIGTVVTAPADNAAITIFGTASQARRQNLAFHRDAYALGFAPLQVLSGCEGYVANVKGVSVRVMTFADGKADMEHTRIDVLYGGAMVRPDHSVRITE